MLQRTTPAAKGFDAPSPFAPPPPPPAIYDNAKWVQQGWFRLALHRLSHHSQSADENQPVPLLAETNPLTLATLSMSSCATRPAQKRLRSAKNCVAKSPTGSLERMILAPLATHLKAAATPPPHHQATEVTSHKRSIDREFPRGVLMITH